VAIAADGIGHVGSLWCDGPAEVIRCVIAAVLVVELVFAANAGISNCTEESSEAFFGGALGSGAPFDFDLMSRVRFVLGDVGLETYFDFVWRTLVVFP